MLHSIRITRSQPVRMPMPNRHINGQGHFRTPQRHQERR